MILPKLLAAAVLFAASPICAHEGLGPNGGRIEEGGGFHVELVTKDGQLDVYLSDAAEKAVPAEGYKGTAIFVVDGKPARIVLEPAQGNRLSGSVDGPIAADAKGAVRLTQPDGKTASVSFH